MNKQILEKIKNNCKINIFNEYDDNENVYYKETIIFGSINIKNKIIKFTEKVITNQNIEISNDIMYKKAYHNIINKLAIEYLK